ncbi:hypothetical protein PilKf_00873 [Pillotina sp. SPG140]
MSDIDFTKEYNREDWVGFLESHFLPEDFKAEEGNVPYTGTYTQEVTKLGECPSSLGLTVFELQHKSQNDARVGLSKEAFRLVRNYTAHNKALILFVPKNNGDVYRFSFVEFNSAVNEKGKVTRDYSNPRRYSFLLGKHAKVTTPQQCLVKKDRVKDYSDLRSRFSVDVVTKEFYGALFAWYEWALPIVRYPEGTNNAVQLKNTHNEMHLIRLITRLIFVWFIKQKNLVPEWIFNETDIHAVLKSFSPQSQESGDYYNGILQNLFFATLNKEITERGFTKDKSEYGNSEFGINSYYRDRKSDSYFKVSTDEIKQKFADIPFLNGGLFECLDKSYENPKKPGYTVQEYHDGFSREKARCAFVPDILFFGNGENGNPEGLITLFNRYNFTVEENTPVDIDVALDPELLGKVFENLLGTYNTETSTLARKSSGSFYTPREIVEYMVDSSLKAYFKEKLTTNGTNEHELEEKLDKLFSYNEVSHDFNNDEAKALINAIDSCKILDPACGSGAFPMGILHKLVFVLGKLDPHNKQWEEKQIEKARLIDDATIREKVISDIEIAFNNNELNYGRKLYLIENCIYGIDIQPIAIQISKLRFFISLIVDQKAGGTKENNYNILPLPNLETKFVAANTLIGVEKSDDSMALLEIEEIKVLQKELLEIRHRHFNAKTANQKKALRDKDKALCEKLAKMLEEMHYYSNKDAQQMAAWDPYNQNVSSLFFDIYWMFGIKDGFDVVIGNPPYYVITNIRPDKTKLENIYSILKSGRMNIYQLFFGRGETLLSPSGCMTFIHPKTLFADSYLSATRKYLLDNFKTFTLINIISRTDTFGAVLQSVVVSLWDKNRKTSCRVAEVSKKTEFENIQYLSLSHKDIVSQNGVFLVSNNRIVYEIAKKCHTVKRAQLNFRTGNIEWNKYIKYLSSNRDNTSKRLIYAENIQRYYFAQSVKRKDTTFINGKLQVPVLPCLSIFTQRTTAVEQPRRIIASIIDPKDFDISIVSENSTNIFECDDIKAAYYILGILNSKLIDFYFRLFNSNTHVSSGELNRLPLPIRDNSCKFAEKIEKLVDQILSAKAANPKADTGGLERQIDNLVYQLYGLTTEEEIKMIEGEATK